MQLPKCQKCGCMADTLQFLAAAPAGADAALGDWVTAWSAQMQPVKYACLGCDPCYPAVAQNLFVAAFPTIEPPALSCDFQVTGANWPPVVGEYFVLDAAAPVAVSTLASVELAEALAQRRPAGLALAGKTETENIGIDKIIKNCISNPALRHLLVCGRDSAGHQTGQTLLALARNGIDASGRVVGSPGKRPVLRNVTRAEVEQFRQQVAVVDLLGCEDVDDICARIEALAPAASSSCGCCGGDTRGQAEPPAPAAETGCGCGDGCDSQPAAAEIAAVVAALPSGEVALDRAGYFVIVPLAARQVINVEYYGYDNTLLAVVEGGAAREIYLTLIEQGWVTELSHAAYLGKELAKAELSLAHGFKYLQDGA